MSEDRDDTSLDLAVDFQTTRRTTPVIRMSCHATTSTIIPDIRSERAAFARQSGGDLSVIQHHRHGYPNLPAGLEPQDDHVPIPFDPRLDPPAERDRDDVATRYLASRGGSEPYLVVSGPRHIRHRIIMPVLRA